MSTLSSDIDPACLKIILTSSSVRCSLYLSSCKATPLNVTISAAPPQTIGRVWNSHCSWNTPGLGDLKTKGNFMVSPGRTTPVQIKIKYLYSNMTFNLFLEHSRIRRFEDNGELHGLTREDNTCVKKYKV